MIKQKQKPCKGRAEARGYGCGEVGFHNSMRRGLCNSCWVKWIKETEEGKALAAKRAVKKIKEIRREGKKRRKKEKIRLMGPTEYRNTYLQPVVNEIARLIDYGQGCVATGNFGKMNGGHYYTQKAHSNIALNLHNIHIQSFESNHFKSGDEAKYLEGIQRIYGEEYAAKMLDLKRVYLYRVISKQEMQEVYPKALRVVNWLRENKAIRDPAKRIRMREMINNYFGLY